MVRTRRRWSCSGSTSSCRLDIKVADRTSMLPNCLRKKSMLVSSLYPILRNGSQRIPYAWAVPKMFVTTKRCPPTPSKASVLLIAD